LSHSTVLGFDFGLKQIGLALAHPVTEIATPLTIIKAKEGKPNWDDVQNVIEEWKPSLLVVGLPLNMDGSLSAMAGRAKKFANRLHGRYGLQVELHDERLSSFEARQTLSEQPLLSVKYDKIDAIAAAKILESWMLANKPLSIK